MGFIFSSAEMFWKIPQSRLRRLPACWGPERAVDGESTRRTETGRLSRTRWRMVENSQMSEASWVLTFLYISLSNSWSAALGKSHSWKGTTTASLCHFAADFPMVFQRFSNYGSRTLEQHLLFDTQKLISPGSRHGQWKGQDSGRASRQDCARRFCCACHVMNKCSWTDDPLD